MEDAPLKVCPMGTRVYIVVVEQFEPKVVVFLVYDEEGDPDRGNAGSLPLRQVPADDIGVQAIAVVRLGRKVGYPVEIRSVPPPGIGAVRVRVDEYGRGARFEEIRNVRALQSRYRFFPVFLYTRMTSIVVHDYEVPCGPRQALGDDVAVHSLAAWIAFYDEVVVVIIVRHIVEVVVVPEEKLRDGARSHVVRPVGSEGILSVEDVRRATPREQDIRQSCTAVQAGILIDVAGREGLHEAGAVVVILHAVPNKCDIDRRGRILLLTREDQG
mmetsp:Transcript_60107/g.178210  ORF Transcript_60107/g.178210 Transcript_60107/m.178210 type:complete len:271 (-) Transcript_60107:187-999(-)